MLQVGPWRIQSVVTGHVRLDGGAMFGVVPRVVWERLTPPDEKHRILLATRTLLAVHDRAQRVVLVDTGTGHKWEPALAERYGVEPIPAAIEAALARLDLGPDDVTDLVVTHLHFDHCGGMTEWEAAPGGATRLRFPKARHWITRRHWDHARAPTLRDRASFFPHDFAALEPAGVLAFVDDPHQAEGIPDVNWQISSGHTPGQLLPRFNGGSGERDVLFVGDLVPTTAHLPPAWVMAYDLVPLTTLAERVALWKQCREDDFLVTFPHDPQHGIVRLAFEQDRPQIGEVLG